MRRSTVWTFFGCALALVTATATWIYRLRQPLSVRAGEVHDAIIRGDAKVLLGYATTREISEEGLTEDKLRKVLDRMVLPYIATSTNRIVETADDTGDFHAISSRLVKTRDGRTIGIGADLWQTDEGNRTSVLRIVLRNSWYLRYPRKKAMSPSEYFRQGAKQVLADKALLESLGFKGRTPIDPNEPFLKWDEVASRNLSLALAYEKQEAERASPL